MLADEAATSIAAKDMNSSSVAVPALDLKPFLRKSLRNYWQRSWDNETSNKLHVIKPQLGNWPPISKTRRTEVIICRLRIGHTYGTHSYLLTGDEPPTCGKCGTTLTVLHVLLECHALEAHRKKYFRLPYRQQVPLHPAMFLGNDPLFESKSILAFINDVGVLDVIHPRDS